MFPFSTGDDGKKFKTRSGETVKLMELLDEAVRIAGDAIQKRNEEEGYKARPNIQIVLLWLHPF